MMQVYVVTEITTMMGGQLRVITEVIGVGHSVGAAAQLCNEYLMRETNGIASVQLKFTEEQNFDGNKPYYTGSYINRNPLSHMTYRIEPFEMAVDDHA